MNPTATINIAGGDYNGALQKRQLRKVNVGFYCTSCGEFVAVAIAERDKQQTMENIEYGCDGPIEFNCPFCQHRQKRIVTEIQTILLSEGNKRKGA